jgi:hypothetical protein
MAPNYRSLVPGGFFSSTPFDRTMPVSMRCNNPGAINGATWETRYPGYVDTVETTPGNKTTIFEAPEYGVAVWWELLRRYATAGVTTVGGIINRYGGGQDYSNYIRFVEQRTGFEEGHRISLDDDATLLAFGKAMFHYEAGRPTPLHDNQIVFGFRLARADGDLSREIEPETSLLAAGVTFDTHRATMDKAYAAPPIAALSADPFRTMASAILTTTVSAANVSITDVQKALTELGLLDPPADGHFGPVSRWALAEAIKPAGLDPPQEEEPISQTIWNAVRQAQPLPLNPGSDFAGNVVRAMQRGGYWINRHPDCFNIVYVEGMDVDGTPNQDRPNHFDSVRALIRVVDGVPKIVGAWEATTEPSKYWTEHPMNRLGAARIKFGQWKAWNNGQYHGFPALLQVSDITVYRDIRQEYKRYDPTYTGNFGIHNHQGYNYPRNDEGRSSAGCLVGRLNDGHREFMQLVQTDKRFVASNGYRFMVTVMPASQVVARA